MLNLKLFHRKDGIFLACTLANGIFRKSCRRKGMVQSRVTLAPAQVGAETPCEQRRSGRIGGPLEAPKCYPESGHFEPCRRKFRGKTVSPWLGFSSVKTLQLVP